MTRWMWAVFVLCMVGAPASALLGPIVAPTPPSMAAPPSDGAVPDDHDSLPPPPARTGRPYPVPPGPASETNSVNTPAPASAVPDSIELRGLDDVTGDGRGDLLQIRRSYGEETDGYRPVTTTLSLVDGADFHEAWTRPVPDYWRLDGDYTGDGRPELLLYGEGEGSWVQEAVPLDTPATSGTASVYKGTIPVTHTVVDAATGRDLFTIESTETMHGVGAFAFASGPGAYAFAWNDIDQYVYTALTPSPSPSLPGGFLETSTYRYVHGSNSFMLAGTYASLWTDGFTVQRFDVSGRSLWTYESDPVTQETSVRSDGDLTGDGVADLLVVARVPYAWTSAYVASVFPSTPEPPARLDVRVVDGRTGAELWSYETSPFIGEAEALAGARTREGVPTVFVNIIGYEPGPALRTFGSRLLVLKGPTGDEITNRHWDNLGYFTLPFADADRDGAEDFLFVQGEAEGSFPDVPNEPDVMVFGVANWALVPLWSMEFTDGFEVVDDPFWAGNLPDVNGDDVPDISAILYGADDSSPKTLRAISGATGRTLWDVVLTADVREYEILPDLTGDGADDLALVEFEDVRAPSPDAGPASASPAPTTAKASRSSSAPSTIGDGYVELRSGIDANLVWRRQIFDRSTDPPPGTYVKTTLGTTADLNGKGSRELLVTVEAFAKPNAFAVSSDGSVTMYGGEPASEPRLAAVLDGLDGQVLHVFGPDLPPAAAPLEAPPSALPTVGPLVALLALVVVALRRRD
jgi:hypothetical protein